MEFLKVELSHPDHVIGSQITPACKHLHWTPTGPSNLYMIDSPCSVFDLEPEQHLFVEESQYETKAHKHNEKHASNFYQKRGYEAYSAVMLPMFSLLATR